MKEEIKKENQEFEKDKYVGVFQKSKKQSESSCSNIKATWKK